MNNLARAFEQEDVFQDFGAVIAVEAETFIVRSSAGDVRARRAAGCLLLPRLGDFVLIAVRRGKDAYVLVVLERDVERPAELTVEGDLQIQAKNGRVSVAGRHGVDLASGGDVSVVSDGFQVNAATGNVVLEQLSLLATAVKAEVSRIGLVAGAVEAVADRLRQRLKRSYRTVEETDYLRAERIDYAAEKTANLHAENTVVTAEQLVKVDGDQIHLG